VYGHHHLAVTSLEAARKFWVAALGGVDAPAVSGAAVKLANVLVFLDERVPAGGTKGTTVNHIGFQVPDVRAMVDTLRAAEFPMVTRAELPQQFEVKDDIALIPDLNASVAFVMAPDETKVEFIENTAMIGSIAMHHIHFAAPDVQAMRDWYVKTLGAKPGRRGRFEVADMPGVNLTYSPAADAVIGTRGRALDHIGFEVKELEAVTERLAADGVQVDQPYTRVPGLGMAVAFITDPWGTYIELTEGLDRIQ
jgi:catechol 2,3-dioxygenase-like lactoylglutathione lyase family enzyme